MLIVIAFFIPEVTSAPGGIGKSANDGCLCHGEADANTEVEVQGLPASYESNTTYNFSIKVSSETIPSSETGEIGGFRMLISGGAIDYNDDEGLIQELDDGWTHTESGNSVRVWNFSFTSPSDNSSFVDFTIYGNAVNGNQASTGDEWNSLKFRLPGTLYEGELLSSSVDEFSPMDYSVGIISLCVLGYLVIRTLRD